MKAKLKDNQGITLVVVLMVMAILLSIIGAGLLFSGINTKISGNYNVGLKAFYAADTGINAGINQLGADPTAATAAFTKDMGGGVAYRSGHRSDLSAQPLQYKGLRTEAGYSLNMGSGYNTSGYAFYRYQMNVTGTYTTGWGAVVAGRELEAQVTYGPMAR
jgi:Tfp pilus assembly protein PilX